MEKTVERTGLVMPTYQGRCHGDEGAAQLLPPLPPTEVLAVASNAAAAAAAAAVISRRGHTHIVKSATHPATHTHIRSTNPDIHRHRHPGPTSSGKIRVAIHDAPLLPQYTHHTGSLQSDFRLQPAFSSITAAIRRYQAHRPYKHDRSARSAASRSCRSDRLPRSSRCRARASSRTYRRRATLRGRRGACSGSRRAPCR